VVEPSAGSPQKAMFMLRVIREISQLSLSRDRFIAGPALDSTSSPDIIRPLHLALGNSVRSRTIQEHQKYLDKLRRASVVSARALWEGTPSLPIQPSPGAFKLLRRLSKDMVACGADLWSSGAVDAAKKSACEQLESQMIDFVEKTPTKIVEEPATNGHTNSDDGEEITNGHAEAEEPKKNIVAEEKLTQLLLDALYFQIALSNSVKDQTEKPALQRVINKIIVSLDMDAALVTRIRKSAGDYWKRTYLIFALLVPEGRH
jgi:hypothetical protein